MIFANLVAALALFSPVSQQTVEWKRTDDGAGAFAQAYFAKCEEEPAIMEKTKRLPTLYFYWKARWLLNFQVGGWEHAQLNISRIVLEVLDPASGEALKEILDAHPADKAFEATEEETKEFRGRLMVLSGLDKALDGGPEMTKLEKFEFDAGVSLGEIAGKVVQYHDTHSIPTANKMFNETLDGFKKIVSEAPADANPKTVAALKVIADTPRKDEYTLAEIQTLAGQIKATMMTVIP